MGSQIQTGLPLFLHGDLTPSPQLVLDKDKKTEFLLGKKAKKMQWHVSTASACRHTMRKRVRGEKGSECECMCAYSWEMNHEASHGGSKKPQHNQT